MKQGKAQAKKPPTADKATKRAAVKAPKQAKLAHRPKSQ